MNARKLATGRENEKLTAGKELCENQKINSRKRIMRELENYRPWVENKIESWKIKQVEAQN